MEIYCLQGEISGSLYLSLQEYPGLPNDAQKAAARKGQIVPWEQLTPENISESGTQKTDLPLKFGRKKTSFESSMHYIAIGGNLLLKIEEKCVIIEWLTM